jgi:hypothetical protein
MIHENKKNNDQIAGGTDYRSLTGCQSWSCHVFVPLFTQRLYTTPVVCDTGLANIFQDRLSRHHSTDARPSRPCQTSGTQKDTALFNPMLCRATAAKKRAFESLLKAVFARAGELKLLGKSAQGAIDSTGMESRHISRHYIIRKGYKRFLRYHWPKITTVCHTDTYLFACCIVTRGPSNDSPEFIPAVKQAHRCTRFKRMLADAGYDGEHNHRVCREELGFIESIIALNKRRSRKWPKSPYRRLMKEQFPKKIYNQRWHVESAISQNKRILGSALRARSEHSRERECFLRILTHDLMIIRRAG